MPYPPRPVTGQAVSAARKRAGLNRTAPLLSTGRYGRDGRLIRGSEQWSPGYQVKTERSEIRVRYRAGGVIANPEATADLRSRMLQRYADVLVSAGFRVQVDCHDGRARWVVVCGRLR